MNPCDEPWSESLVKTTIGPEVFMDIEDESSGPARERLERLRALCSESIESKPRLQEVRRAVAALQKERKLTDYEAEVFELVREELKEIASDLGFVASNRGRFTLAANDWVQKLYRTVRSEARFADAMVGLHAEREALLAVGSVATGADLDDLRRIIVEHESPWPVDFQVRVTTS